MPWNLFYRSRCGLLGRQLRLYMMNSILEFALQYGIAGLALYMMYSITFNHLVDMRDILIEIRDILAKN
jgi:hypothetical protein